jgi:hypothetical protein
LLINKQCGNSGQCFVDENGRLTSTPVVKRASDNDFGLGAGNASEAIDIDELLARAAIMIGKEGREWKHEDRVGRRDV